jgi:alkanesulfonate monooxygenase SsuD/methylene tetrahydromethanopterin reductase-like flavin-dependent oxidoreductase (luciferase family)
MTRRSCQRFRANEVRLWLSVIAYKPGEPVAAVGAAQGDRQLDADQFAAAAGKDRRSFDQAHPSTTGCCWRRGRFIFGIGAGWLAEESEAMGVDFRRRWRITREYLAAMKQLWTESEASFQGEFIKFPPVQSYPKPAQKPHPPIHIGAGFGARTQRALRDTVAMGDGWMPVAIAPDQLAKELTTLKKMCDEAGRDFSRIEISMTFPVIEGDPRQAVRRYREAGCHRLMFLPPTLAPDRAEGELEELARTYVLG